MFSQCLELLSLSLYAGAVKGFFSKFSGRQTSGKLTSELQDYESSSDESEFSQPDSSDLVEHTGRLIAYLPASYTAVNELYSCTPVIYG